MPHRLCLLAVVLILPACSQSKEYRPVTVNTPGGPTVVMVGVSQAPLPPSTEYDAQGNVVPNNPAPTIQYDAQGNAVVPPPPPVHYDAAGKPLPPPEPVVPTHNEPVTIHNPFSGDTTVEVRKAGPAPTQP